MWKLSHKRRLTQEKLKSEEENGRLFFWFPGQEGIKKTLSKMESCLSPRQKIEATETVRKRVIYLPLHLWRKWVESREEDLSLQMRKRFESSGHRQASAMFQSIWKY